MAFTVGRITALAVLGAAALGAAGCEATVNPRGFIYDPTLAQKIRVGVDTKSSLQAYVGSPSTTSTFTDNTWYYISTVQEDFLFLKPTETARQVVAVSFGPGEVVTNVQTLGPENGVQIAFSDRETPTRGRELTFLQQIFGNVGRGGAIGIGDTEADDPRNRR